MEHSFNANKFHELSDDKGSTLTIIKVKEDENSFFGGVAIPSWGGELNSAKLDPKNEFSWLFKLQIQNNGI